MDEIKMTRREKTAGMHTCPICGAKFYTLNPEIWCYKIRNKKRCVCSYTCMRKYEKEQEQKKKQK